MLSQNVEFKISNVGFQSITHPQGNFGLHILVHTAGMQIYTTCGRRVWNPILPEADFRIQNLGWQN